MDDFEIELKNEFLTEAAEMLEQVESDMLVFEKNPQDEGIMSRIFRMAHNIKGSAMSVEFNELGAFAHKMENLLDQLRSNILEINSEIMDTLLQSTDKIREFIKGLNEDFNCTIETQELISKIEICLNGGPAIQEAEPEVNNELRSAEDEPAEVAEATGLNAVAPPLQKSNPARPVETARTKHFEQSRLMGRLLGNEKPKILICDDEPDMLEFLEFEVSSINVDVVTASNGVEALKVIGETKIDAIISDLKMPGMDGIEFVSRVREKDGAIPVIFFSGYAERQHIVRFIELGAYDFLGKPVEPERLKVTVRNAITAKYNREATTRLSSLNFKAYMVTMKFADALRHKDEVNAKELQIKLESILDEISKLTNLILNPQITLTLEPG
jgi:DNA-binding response OmpR family regulator/HPt (histidine-containing phosphotransfer) domain-containing protein